MVYSKYVNRDEENHEQISSTREENKDGRLPRKSAAYVKKASARLA